MGSSRAMDAIWVTDDAGAEPTWHLAPRRHRRLQPDPEALCGLRSSPPRAPWERIRWRLPDDAQVCPGCRRRGTVG